MADTHRELTVAYLERIWPVSDPPSWVAVGAGTEHRLEAGKVRHGKWDDRHFRWPDQKDDLLDYLAAHVATADLYVTPGRRANPVRNEKAKPQPGRWLWCDLDGAGPEALTRLEVLLAQGGFTVTSGRGAGHLHVYIALRRPVEPETIETLNRGLVAFLHADPSPSALNGYLRPPGTLNHKPVLLNGGHPAPVTVDRTSDGPGWTGADLESIFPPVGQSRSRDSGEVKGEPLPDRLPPRVARALALRLEDRSKLLYVIVAACREAGLSEGQALTAARSHEAVVAKYRTRLAVEVDRIWSKLPTSVHHMERRPLSDLGNAERLADLFGDLLRYNRSLDWVAWDGKRWKLNAHEAALAAAKTAIRAIPDEAEGLPEDEATAVEKWARTSESRSHVMAMVELARAEPALTADVDDFDADPLLVNCLNGVIDLRTGDRIDHRPDLMLTHLAGASYRPDAGCPRWVSFLEQVQPDPEIRYFLQQAAGYSLTGLSTAHVLLICHGGGANGKTTFLEALRHAYGDYAQQTPVSTLMRRKAGDATNDVARLRGARFVVAAESEQDQRLAEASIKRLTGGDTLSARYLFKEFFDFVPSHTLWLATNYRPRVMGTDDAIWRRLVMVPWPVTVDPDDQDPGLPAALAAEADGILAWAVDGALTFLTDGLTVPRIVSDATSLYRFEQDTLADFIAEHCVVGADKWVSNIDLYKAYADASKGAGEDTTMSNKAFTAEMLKRGFERRRSEATGARRWQGIGLST